MCMLKLLSFLLVGLYLFFVGLEGFGYILIPVSIVNFFAVAAGVLFIARGIKYCCNCNSCCKTDHCKTDQCKTDRVEHTDHVEKF